MAGDMHGIIAEGNDALASGDWQQARALFEGALDVEKTAEGLFGLAEALWWLGDLNGSIDHRERAYGLFRRRPDPVEAFLSALYLVLDYQGHVGNYAASAGWLARAERLVEEFELVEFQGWLELARSNEDCDPVDGEQLARQALEFASASNDLDLELCALSQIGALLVQQGRIREGIVYLDEAMAGSLGGEGGNLDTVALTSCNMMVACINAAEFERAVQWVQASDRFAARYGCPFVYAQCRTVYGSVLFATGDWPGAEKELKAAVTLAKGSVPVYHAQALAMIAELRLAQGRIEEAGRLLSGIEDHEWAVPAVARMHLIAGRPAAAEEMIRRRLRAVRNDRLERGWLLELLGEAEIAQGRPRAAVEHGQTLLELGSEFDCRILTVRGERLLGRAGLGSDSSVIREHLETALSGFIELQMVYEAARTRLLLGECLSGSQPEVAKVEALASRAAFEELGARRDADRAAALLRTLGVKAARFGPRARGSLTKREREVFVLLSEGLSNPEIAERLYISRKTVEHHVARVLAKLGVRNRAEAAAEAIRQLGVESAVE